MTAAATQSLKAAYFAYPFPFPQVYDVDGFKLLTAIVENVSAGLIQPYMSSILSLLLTRMQSARTIKVRAGEKKFDNDPVPTLFSA